MSLRLWSWLKHAFAVESAEGCEPNERQRQICDLLVSEVSRRGLITPALLLLETSKPLNYIGAQLLHFWEPILSAVCNQQSCREFAQFLERPGAIEYLCRRLEETAQSPVTESKGETPSATGYKSEM